MISITSRELHTELDRSQSPEIQKRRYEDAEDEICRICLKSGSLSIFSTSHLQDDLKQIAGIDVQKDDSLPQHLCTTCREDLNAAIVFRSQAQRSDIILRKQQKGRSQESYVQVTADSESQQDETDSDSASVYLEYAESEVSEGDKDVSSSFEEIMVADLTQTKFPQCEICYTNFRTLEQVEEHSSMHMNAKICEVCHNIVHKDAYEVHLHIHRINMKRKQTQNSSKTECPLCNTAVGANYLKDHMALHLGKSVNKVNCPVCNKTLRKESLAGHMQRFHSKNGIKVIKKIKCPICSRMFSESLYKRHVASHGRKSVYVCEECGKELSTRSSYSTHILTHKNEFKFKCDFCPYRGKHRGLLRVHLLTHKKEYLHKCKTCNACFLTKSNLIAHEKTHSKSARFICPECGKAYAKEDTLQQHKISVHEGIKAFKCEMCPKQFGTKEVFLVHMKRVHKIFKYGFGKHARSSYLQSIKNDT